MKKNEKKHFLDLKESKNDLMTVFQALQNSEMKSIVGGLEELVDDVYEEEDGYRRKVSYYKTVYAESTYVRR